MKIGCALPVIALLLGVIWLSEPTYIEGVDVAIGPASLGYVRIGQCQVWGHATVEEKYVDGTLLHWMGLPGGDVVVEQGKGLLPQWLITGVPEPRIAVGECMNNQWPAAVALYDKTGKRIAYARCAVPRDHPCLLSGFAAPSQSRGRITYWLRMSGMAPIPIVVTRSIELKSAYWEGLMGI